LKKSVKTFTDEPLELLKSARRQVTGENLPPNETTNQNTEDPQKLEDEQSYKIKKAESDGRHLEALESELKDIRRQKLFNDLMVRIQNGEDVPLEEFTELSYEQKDVLKAQIEVVKKQKLNSQNSNDQLIQPTAKKGRQMFGQKQSAQKQTTRVEKPVPPSG
jgi:hypothetical protein